MEIYRHDSDRSVGIPGLAWAPNSRSQPQLPPTRPPFDGLSEAYGRRFGHHEDVNGYSSTSTRNQLNSVYNFPPPPPPPALPSRLLVEHGETDGYSHPQNPSHNREPLRKVSFIQRLGTVIPRRLSRQQGYGVLGEDDSSQQDMHSKSGTDAEDRINFDLSGFGGPIALDDLSTVRGNYKAGLGNSAGATLATQYEKSDNHRISRLGEGMGTIKKAPVWDMSSFEGGLPQNDSNGNFQSRNEIQKLAETSGEIVMLEGMSTVLGQS